jgi:hypothetical protein
MSSPLGPATQGTLGALNASLVVGVQNSGKTGVQITGVFTGTLSFFANIDGSTNVLINAFPVAGTGGLGAATPAPVTTVTAAGVWQIQSVGLSQIVVMMTAYTSGSAIVSICPSVGG